MSAKDELIRRAGAVESYLSGCLRGQDVPDRLLAAMEYSLLAGGKRFRPVLCLSFASMHGCGPDAVMPFAAGIELIHTYSLIHDDLPAMDDDDLRRGKPSCHRRFDEATAVLAGDGLLTEAFGLMCDVALGKGADALATLQAVRLMVKSSGAEGMVGGQQADMDMTGRSGVGLQALQKMHAMKTGALITGSCACGAMLARTSEADVERATIYGQCVGAAFQIADDILDVVGDEAEIGKPVGSDEVQGKVTYPSLLGLDESRKLAYEFADRAVNQLDPYTGEDKNFLAELARYIVQRVN